MATKELKSQEKPNPDKAILVEIQERNEGQRLDNFLVFLCKGVPKSHLFRIIRSGEVRINRKRAEANSRLCLGDLVRIPPIRVASTESFASEVEHGSFSNKKSLINRDLIPIIYEDSGFLAINKPSGLAVHGGSGNSEGVIEHLRALRADTHEDLELVHRIDRETSGILLIAKKRSALRVLQEQLRNKTWKKFYLALVIGAWPERLKVVDKPLLKTQPSSKEKKVFVSDLGDSALSHFKVIQRFKTELSDLTLIQARIFTGRTHQIRVHTSTEGFPIAGDDRYGAFELNKKLQKIGLKRMFLHSSRLELQHPTTGEPLVLEAPLPQELESFISQIHQKDRSV